MDRTSKNIDQLYRHVANDLLNSGEVVNGTRELNNVKLILTDITKNIVSIRDISPSYLFGEWLWYINGDDSLEFISKFSSFWKNISDDGKTCNSAYGYLIQHKHGFDQADKVVELLRKDPESRRAKININTPNENVIETKDEPCTMSLHFMIRNGKLHCTAIMRSNDIWFGFPYDVAFFTELQKMIAEKLHVGYGTYTHFAVSLHVYDRDAGNLRKVALQYIPSKPIIFNRSLFFDRNINRYLYEIAKKSGKEALMAEMSLLGIYDDQKNDQKNDQKGK